MNTFKYEATSKKGDKVEGIVEAYDQYDAVDKVMETCSVVHSITQIGSSRESLKGKDVRFLIGNKKVKDKVLSVVCSQFAIILKAGLPLVRTVEIIAAQTSDREMKNILQQVAGDVMAGFGLAKSFGNKGKKRLPMTFIETVRAGEESGTLEESFAKLEKYYAKSSKIKSKVTSALAYPIFVLVLAVIVLGIIMVVAVPMFATAFEGTGTELPGITRGVIAISNFFTHYYIYIAIFIVLVVILFRVAMRNDKFRLILAKLRLRVPLLGKISIMKAASQFANTLSTMLTAGLPMIHAVDITGKVIENCYLGREVSSTVVGLSEGKRLGDCMRGCEYFPPMLTDMASVGEESGSIESTLEVVGAYFDNEVDVKSSRLLSFLEPAIICILAMAVIFILLAVYLPMMSMYDSV